MGAGHDGDVSLYRFSYRFLFENPQHFHKIYDVLLYIFNTEKGRKALGLRGFLCLVEARGIEPLFFYLQSLVLLDFARFVQIFIQIYLK